MRSSRFIVPAALALIMSACAGAGESTDSEVPISEVSTSTTSAVSESSVSEYDTTADGTTASDPPESVPSEASVSSAEDDVATEPSLDLPLATTSLNPGEAARLSVGLHCGIGVLDRLINDQVWRATGYGNGFTPSEWKPDESLPDGPIDVQALLSDDGEILTITRNGRSEEYASGGTAFEVEDFCE